MESVFREFFFNDLIEDGQRKGKNQTPSGHVIHRK
ncbi:hypothetical protein VINI7043_05991 [Vibrio nigripulchritudo ATCC 27043]|nr:hypothetical protein VINI7043_05991 [Vibrio nigripulchritudo ATCC 27043]